MSKRDDQDYLALRRQMFQEVNFWQEEHAKAVHSLKAAESRILELEKEIAALPKKIEARIIDAKSVQAKWLCDKVDGRWNAALDKATEMLSRMEVIAGQPRATVEKAVVEIRKLKEIAALRETK